MAATTVPVAEDAIRKIFSAVSHHHFKNVLVLHGRSFSPMVSQVKNDLSSQRLTCKCGVPPNPDMDFIHDLAREITLNELDLIIAIGGGSVIDTSKLLIAIASGTPEADLLNNTVTTTEKPVFWVAPTTAGSGSEATHFAVVYSGGRKYSVANSGLLPDRVFLDASLTMSCPPTVTIASGVDALCQSIESFWSPAANDESKMYALQGLDLILANMPVVVATPHNFPARQAMLNGAHLAGKAINLTKTTAAHALSYGLTTALGIPHGIAVMLVFGPLVQLMDKKYRFFAEPMAPLEKAFASWGKNFVEGILAFRSQMLRSFSVHEPIFSDTVPEKVLPRLMDHVNVDRLKNHPVALTKSDIASIYISAIAPHSNQTAVEN